MNLHILELKLMRKTKISEEIRKRIKLEIDVFMHIKNYYQANF